VQQDLQKLTEECTKTCWDLKKKGSSCDLELHIPTVHNKFEIILESPEKVK
jgi:hypothetical protein